MISYQFYVYMSTFKCGFDSILCGFSLVHPHFQITNQIEENSLPLSPKKEGDKHFILDLSPLILASALYPLIFPALLFDFHCIYHNFIFIFCQLLFGFCFVFCVFLPVRSCISPHFPSNLFCQLAFYFGIPYNFFRYGTGGQTECWLKNGRIL